MQSVNGFFLVFFVSVACRYYSRHIKNIDCGLFFFATAAVIYIETKIDDEKVNSKHFLKYSMLVDVVAEHSHHY